MQNTWLQSEAGDTCFTSFQINKSRYSLSFHVGFFRTKKVLITFKLSTANTIYGRVMSAFLNLPVKIAGEIDVTAALIYATLKTKV